MSLALLSSVTLLYLAQESSVRSGSVYSAFLAADELLKAAKILYEAGYHLEDIAGLDATEGCVAVYHFDHFTQPGRVTLRVLAPHNAPIFPSIAPVFQGAEWHERETADFYGFDFYGNPNLVPLLLPENMVNVNPLRKDEGVRAPLHVLLHVAEREVLFKAEGFTLLDSSPAVDLSTTEESADEPQVSSLPAVKAASTLVVKAATPLAVKKEAPVTVKADASLAVKTETSLVARPDAPKASTGPVEAQQNVKKSVPEKKTSASADKKAKAPVKNSAKAAVKKGDASDA